MDWNRIRTPGGCVLVLLGVLQPLRADGELTLKVVGKGKLVGIGLVTQAPKGDDQEQLELWSTRPADSRAAPALLATASYRKPAQGQPPDYLKAYISQVFGGDPWQAYRLKFRYAGTCKVHMFVKNKEGYATFLVEGDASGRMKIVKSSLEVLPPSNAAQAAGSKGRNPVELNPEGGVITAMGLEP